MANMKNIALDTPCGKVRGTSLDGVRTFLGIRYASAERWEYPKEVTHWDGVYEAVHYGPAPIQERAYVDGVKYKQYPFYCKEFWEGVETSYSEDCLYLNIWTPENCENCPVLIAIYGGGLVSGQADEKEFDGTEYAKRGIILVTFNYRVNIFGLFSSEELDKEAGKSGNYALYDQLAAFSWVRRNIESFGGDVSRMTLIGQSAGAACADTQIKAKINEGLFQGVIFQSSAGFAGGVPDWAKINKSKAQKSWRTIYQASKCKSFEEFRNLPADVLFDMWRKKNKGLAFSSTFADDLFRAEYAKAPCPVNVLCGITSEDTAPAIFYWMTKRFAKMQNGYHPVYAYLFSRQLPGDTHGAWHASDLWYAYGALSRCWRPFTEEDKALSQTMMDYLTQFIKTGDPNSENKLEWLPLEKKQKCFMNFDAGKCEMRRPKIGKLIYTTLTYRGPRM